MSDRNQELMDVSTTDMAERLESVKAGCLGGLVAVLIAAVAQQGSIQVGLNPSTNLLAMGVTVAIAGITGFLFSITYRYTIRTDQNPHLSSGAIAAFGLVRGLTQVTPELQQFNQLSLSDALLLGLTLGWNMLLFALIASVIDLAIRQSWIQPRQ